MGIWVNVGIKEGLLNAVQCKYTKNLTVLRTLINILLGGGSVSFCFVEKCWNKQNHLCLQTDSSSRVSRLYGHIKF